MGSRVRSLKKGQEVTIRVSCYFSQAFRDAIVAEALRQRTTPSDLIAKVMSEYLGNPGLAEREKKIPGPKPKLPAEVSA
jgi:hypothetical protein